MISILKQVSKMASSNQKNDKKLGLHQIEVAF